MEIETESKISTRHIKAATLLGITSPGFPRIEAKEYAITFIKMLLLHREKMNKNLLEAPLSPVIATLWQEVLSSLENENRKLVNIQSGSLIFTLFCPSDSSLEQLQDEKWRIELQAQVGKLLKALGTKECIFKIREIKVTIFIARKFPRIFIR